MAGEQVQCPAPPAGPGLCGQDMPTAAGSWLFASVLKWGKTGIFRATGMFCVLLARFGLKAWQRAAGLDASHVGSGLQCGHCI